MLSVLQKNLHNNLSIQLETIQETICSLLSNDRRFNYRRRSVLAGKENSGCIFPCFQSPSPTR